MRDAFDRTEAWETLRAAMATLRAELPRLDEAGARRRLRQIDRELEKAPSNFISEIESAGEGSRLHRSNHRKMHLDEIEEILSKKEKT